MKPVCLPEKYEILGELGVGGMGAVFHARDKILDRVVALKFLSDNVADNPTFVQRFLTEARAAASLNHPNIVQIYEFGETASGHFLAMEFVDGVTLKKELKRVGRFDEKQTIGLMIQACGPLRVAHAAGIVHRDVKPDNMMLTREGQFKLVDLGLAKRLGEETSHTVTGQSMGTPHYISPEQIMGAKVIDQRSDIYSLGATMYYLATGSPPFDGSSGAHIMSKHLNDPLPDPREIVPDLSPGFCRMLGRMMAKEPRDRYQDVPSLEADFRLLLQGSSPMASGPVDTAVQQTVFMSSPDLGTAAAPLPEPIQEPRVEWDGADVEKITTRLAGHIGPLAKVLVRKTKPKVGSRDELCHELAGHIRRSEDRKAFLRGCVVSGDSSVTEFGSGLSDIALDSTQPIGSATEVPAFELDESQAATAIELLAKQIGPMARILVKRETVKAASLADLTARLAANIPDDDGRETFTTAMARLG